MTIVVVYSSLINEYSARGHEVSLVVAVEGVDLEVVVRAILLKGQLDLLNHGEITRIQYDDVTLIGIGRGKDGVTPLIEDGRSYLKTT